MTDTMLRPEQALAFGTALLVAMGTPAQAAAQVAQSLVQANLCGHDSHGLLRLPWYADFIRDGHADPAASPVVLSRTGSTAVVDGRNGWGQLAARLAADTAAELAGSSGVGVVTARRCNHVGRLGEYVEILAARGLASLMWCNVDPSMAPYGGRTRMLGTDPFAAGIPAGPDAPPIIVDFATAAVAEGKLRIERAAGRSVPPGLIQDADGRPSTDPEDFYAGGALLPFGAHKGFGLAVMVELLGGALSGNHVGFLPAYRWGNGLVLVAIQPGFLRDQAEFEEEVATATDALRTVPPAAGFDRVRLPGDVERETRADRERSGFVVPDQIWRHIVELAARLDVPLP